jgi:hypothetical protein
MKPTLHISIVCLIAVTGCVAPQRPPNYTTIRAKVPTIATLAETKESQEKGGIEIAVVPAAYTATAKTRTTIERAQPPTIAVLLVPSTETKDQVFVEERTTPYLAVEPGRLQFTVRVNNKLSRVFRGQGAVVQFNVAGKMIPFDRIDYKEFLSGIVPPRNEASFSIMGPPFELLPDQGQIGIFLYDVVTATDAAGNVTEKQNFEWYFDYTTKPIEQQAEYQVKRGYVDSTAFQLHKLQEQQQSAR